MALAREKKRAVIVHLNAFVKVTPLVGGYLKAYALANPDVRRDWDITLLNYYLRTPPSSILRALLDIQPDVISFSTYTWNSKLVVRLLDPLLGLFPKSHFLIGGVEVVGRGFAVLRPDWENVAVCNGEGEKTFGEFLLQAADKEADYSAVNGITFYRDGQLITTPAHERIRDLAEIPSPWLSGIFSPADLSEVVLFETNRGCPFACEFCFWGGAIGQKVSKLELDRVKDEITYIGRNKGKTLSLCDANFGLTRNDVAIAEHIARTKERWGFPSRVVFSTSKNNKNSVIEISTIFHRHGLISEQAISLQSMNETALAVARRSNIKVDVYTSLQRTLNTLDVPSFVELIWPLPGETLDSFKQGIQRLCQSGSQGFWIYPLLWLHNVGFAERTEELGVVTIEEPDPCGAARMVIATREVSYNEYIQGLEYAAALFLLFNCRGLSMTLNALDQLGIVSYRDALDAFVGWMAKEREDCISSAWRTGVGQFEELNRYAWRGFLVHAVLHEHRALFDNLLWQFYREALRPRAADSEYRQLIDAAVEFDVLSRPYLFIQTPLSADVPLVEIAVRERRRSRWIIDSPYDFPSMLRAIRTGGGMRDFLERRPVRIAIDHGAGLIFRLASKSEEEHYEHCFQAMRGMGNFAPRYSMVATAETGGDVINVPS
jgi:hypothetical protein